MAKLPLLLSRQGDSMQINRAAKLITTVRFKRLLYIYSLTNCLG